MTTFPTTPSIAQVKHRLPGRVRFKVIGIGDRQAADRIRQCLNDTPGMRCDQINPKTGSLLITHTCSFDEVVDRVNDYAAVYSHGRSLDKGQAGAAARTQRANDDAAAAIAWAELDVAAVEDRLATSAGRGLSEPEAIDRLARDGPNALPEAKRPHPVSFLVDQLVTPPIAMLGAAAAISILTGGLADAVGIAVAISLNSIIGAATEWQSDKTIRGLARPASDRCRVMRSETERTVRINDVVTGDVLVLRPGDMVSADARLVATQHMSVDESALTGESMPVHKEASMLCAADTPIAEQLNMVFRGTAVTGGNGAAIVTATARDTEIGRIQTSSEQAEAPETPMERQLGELGVQLSWLSVAACVAVFAVGLLRGGRLIDMTKAAVSLGVAAVPEGLPAMATTTLALGLRNMRRKGLLVSNLGAVETIGTVDAVCLDKTGTLTRNRIEPAAAYVASRRYSMAHGEIGADSHDLRNLLELIVLNNESEIRTEVPKIEFEGTPTENALLEMAIQGGVNVRRVRRRYPRLEIEHRSEHKPYVTTVHQSGTRGRLMTVKGNPLAVLERCTRVRGGGRIRVLDDQTRAEILAENEDWTSEESFRVLGVAYDRYGQDESPRPNELIWLGLVGLQDPLRHGMKDLIADLHTAGIKTVMITGDQMSTAAAVGRQLSLSGDETLRVLDSRDLSKLDSDVLEALVQQTHIYARVSPANKLEIVQALQRGNKVIAMTGDGINDGPALKAADVGIAMGQADNDVARSVADIVVDEDRLQSVIAALGQGRSIYANVRAAIHYLVATNLSEIELMLAASALGLGMPLTPMQLLWINLATDALPAIALGLEPPKANVLRDPPRDRSEPIIRKDRLGDMFRESTVMTASALLSLALGRMRGGGAAVAGTMAFNTLLVAQLLHAFTCRPGGARGDIRAMVRGNRTLASAVIASLAIQGVGLGLPVARRFLGAAALRFPDLLISLASAAGAFALNEYLKDRPATVARSKDDE